MAFSRCSIVRKATDFPRFFRSLEMQFIAGRRGLSTVAELPGLPSKISNRGFIVSSPWMLLPPGFDGAGNSRHRFFKMKDKQVTELEKTTPDDDARCVGSSHGWLALINPSDCALFLWNHNLGRNVRLPPIQTLPCCMKGTGTPDPQEWSEELIIHKLILTSSAEDSNCIVMVIDGYDQKLAFCRPGDPTWTALDGAFDEYDEITYSFREKKFYALSVNDEIEAWDLGDISSPKRCPMDEVGAQLAKYPFPVVSREERGHNNVTIKEFLCCHRGYLAVDPFSGALLYIRRFFTQVEEDGSVVGLGDEFCMLRYRTIDFDVFKLDLKDLKDTDTMLKYVNCLEYWAVFVGLNHSLCVPTLFFPEFKPNSIYFTDDITPLDNPYRGRDMGVYNLKKDNIKRCLPLELLKKIQSPTVWYNPLEW